MSKLTPTEAIAQGYQISKYRYPWRGYSAHKPSVSVFTDTEASLLWALSPIAERGAISAAIIANAQTAVANAKDES